MLNKVVKYTDYNDVEKEVECHFNLTKVEFARLNAKTGGLDKTLQVLIDNKDEAGMLDFFENLILMSYGVKTSDGEFIKVDEDGNKLSKKFANTLAYEAVLVELLEKEDAAVNFILGIIPKEMADKLKAELAKQNK